MLEFKDAYVAAYGAPSVLVAPIIMAVRVAEDASARLELINAGQAAPICMSP